MKKQVSGVTYEQLQELIKKMLYNGKFTFGGSSYKGHSFHSDNDLTIESVVRGDDLFRIEYISTDENGNERRTYWTDNIYGIADIWSSYGGYLYTYRGDGCSQMRELEVNLVYEFAVRDQYEKITTIYNESGYDMLDALTKVKDRLIGWANCIVLHCIDNANRSYCNIPSFREV